LRSSADWNSSHSRAKAVREWGRLGLGLGLGGPWATLGPRLGHPWATQASRLGHPRVEWRKCLCLQQKCKKGRVGCRRSPESPSSRDIAVIGNPKTAKPQRTRRNTKERPLNPAPIDVLMRQLHANLGWSWDDHAQVQANLGWYGRGRGVAALVRRYRPESHVIAVIGNPKTAKPQRTRRNTKERPLNPAPIDVPMRQLHANLGWSWDDHAQVQANLGWYGRGRGVAALRDDTP
jgi:hypothetical protein